MLINIQEFFSKNRNLIILVPIYLLFIIVVDLVMGIGMKDNWLWELGVKKAKEN